MPKLATTLKFACAVLLAFGLTPADAVQTPNVSQEVRREVDRPNQNAEGRPLPVISHWVTGMHPASKKWGPDNQLQLIDQGHYVLPWFEFPQQGPRQSSDKDFRDYYQAALKRANDLKLPITLLGSQWESALVAAPYLDLPAAENPNVVTAKGEVLKKVSPFGPVYAWRDLGRRLTQKSRMKQLQEWYPDPPRVIFLSNNEQSKLAWPDAEKDVRYVQQYGTGRSNEFKRTVVANGWIERYTALLEGMREGLSSPMWKNNASFVGFEAFGPSFFGRWGGWREHSLYVPGRIDPNPLIWGGASVAFYTNDWDASTDFTTWSPQIEAMNQVFQLKEALHENPKFWFELSVWDGFQPKQPQKDKRNYYAKLGQQFTPQRYAGMVQFGMWLLRPRVVREFRHWTFPWAEGSAYFLALCGAVDRVHTNPVLRGFWRQGELVPNNAHRHPYEQQIPPEYADSDRWFLLDTDANPTAYPWKLSTKIAVYALALVRKDAPQREWLIYAHSPLGNLNNVALQLPGYGEARVDVTVGGSFYLVREDKRTIESVDSGVFPKPPTLIGSLGGTAQLLDSATPTAATQW